MASRWKSVAEWAKSNSVDEGSVDKGSVDEGSVDELTSKRVTSKRVTKARGHYLRRQCPLQNRLSFLNFSILYFRKLENALYNLHHALFLNGIEVGLDGIGKTGDEVEVLAPDALSAKHAFGHLAGTTGSPQVGKELHDFGGIVGHDFSAIGTHTTLVVGDDGSKAEHESLGKLALTLEIGLEARKVACLIFGE